MNVVLERSNISCSRFDVKEELMMLVLIMLLLLVSKSSGSLPFQFWYLNTLNAGYSWMSKSQTAINRLCLILHLIVVSYRREKETLFM